jgi:hypothetical protein
MPPQLINTTCQITASLTSATLTSCNWYNALQASKAICHQSAQCSEPPDVFARMRRLITPSHLPLNTHGDSSYPIHCLTELPSSRFIPLHQFL